MTQKSDALDLERGVFASNDPHEIAVLKKSSEKPQRRKVKSVSLGDVDSDFYINRAGRNPLRPKGPFEAAKHPGRVRYRGDFERGTHYLDLKKLCNLA